MQFPGKVLVLGCGSVCQCTVPLLLEHFELDPSRVTILDMVDNRERVADVLAAGAAYVDRPDHARQPRARYSAATSAPATCASTWPGTSTAARSSTGATTTACATSTRRSSCGIRTPTPPPRTRSSARSTCATCACAGCIASWPDNRGPSAVVEHGANPGLVSHFTKQALVEIAAPSLLDGGRPIDARASRRLWRPATSPRWPSCSGVKVDPHLRARHPDLRPCPRRSTSSSTRGRVEGFYEEGIAPAEMGWGTHERRLPAQRAAARRLRPGQPDLPAQPACKTWVRVVGAGRRDHRHGDPPRRGVHDLRPPDGVGRRRCTRLPARPCTTPTARPTPPSTRCTSWRCATGSCRSASGS